jgi:hypothetical protein
MFIDEQWGASENASTPLVHIVRKATISLQTLFPIQMIIALFKKFQIYGDNNLINKKDFWVYVPSIFMFMAEITIQKFTVYFFPGCEIFSRIRVQRD